MIVLPLFLVGVFLLVGTTIKASKIRENNDLYKLLLEVGGVGFWLIVLSIIFFIWG